MIPARVSAEQIRGNRKMKTKLTVFLLILVLTVGVAACGCGRNQEGSSGSVESSSDQRETDKTEKTDGEAAVETDKPDPAANAQEGTSEDSQKTAEALTADQLTISYFNWDVREKIIAKGLCYTLSLYNGSPYPLLSTEINYRVRDNVTEKELRLFDDFKKDNKKYVDQNEDNHNIILIGKSETYVKTGQYLRDVPVTIGIHSMTWYDTPDYDQFILMKPSTLSLGLVKDDLLYHCQYDFINKAWTVDPDPEELNKWPDTELSALLPKPSCDYYQVTTTEKDNYLAFTVFGMSKEDYKDYADSVKKAGFTKKKKSGEHYYSAEDKDGNTVDLIYDKINDNIDVNVNL